VMRIAIVNWSSRKVGGAETYLDTVISQFESFGFPIAFASEVDEPATLAPISLPHDCSSWCVSKLGASRMIDLLQRWKPDLLYCCGLTSPALETELLRIAPAMFFAHGYYGTCITGAKSFGFPVTRPCTRRFGPGCFLHYYGHRCGGLNPVTMWREYSVQSKRLTNLQQYLAILVPSEYIRAEYLRHGFRPDAVHLVPCPFQRGKFPSAASKNHAADEQPRRLLFVGRMTTLKGGALLIDAVPHAARMLGHPLKLVLAGDGPERFAWQRRADSIRETSPNVDFEFAGWLGGGLLERLYGASDVLVVPSLWPEPSALVGREAGLHGLPQAAFAVGGNPEWLHEGTNGHLAPGDPPTVAGLADAIVRCLADPAHYARLREGAVEVARQFTIERHMASLLALFKKAVTKNSFGGN
jgi:glycosyltransferase involved in cell wall biosynthesis